MQVHLLANPAARGTSTTDDRVEVTRLLGTLGHDVVDLTAATAQGSADAAAAAVAAGAQRLVVVGGDGAVHLAAQAVAGSPTVLGLVPQGTGNDFARALGLLDLSLEDTVRAAVSEPVAVDALRTTHGWAATVATLGFAGDVTARANAMAFPRGESRYTIATIAQLPRLRRLRLVAHLDGVRTPMDTTMLSVGNTAYFGGGMKTCPGARPDDGEMEIVVVGPVSRRTFLSVFPKVFSGRHLEHRAVEALHGRLLQLEAPDAAVDLWADGELLGPLPVDIEVVRGALSVAGARPDAAVDG